tara:strand:- start:1549 stop:3450 length:1902 start_codon:yes stop_codon:yes gene_type:complete
MSDIIVKFKPQGHKALINAIRELEKAQKGVTGTTKQATTATKKQTKANHGLLTSNRLLDHSFATMRSHLLLFNFAMGLGIRQVVRFSQDAAKVQQMETAFNTMSGGATNAAVAVDKLKEATNGTLSEFDLFQQANNAMVLGVTKNSDEMAQMFDMAQRLGAALGKDTKLSIESLVTGIGRQSRLMLDNIGIIVKSEEAYESYAAQLGKSKDELTDAEKKQAFMNATLDAAREKLQSLPQEVLTTDQQFQALSASFADAGVAIGEGLMPVIEPLAVGLTTVADAITPERVKAFATVVGVTLVGAMIAYRKSLEAVILRQTMLGWGALATGAGLLAAEVLVLSGIFDDAEDSLNDFNNTSSQSPLLLQGIQNNLVSVAGAYRAELAVLDERAIIQEQMRLNEIALQDIRDGSFESIEKKQEAERKGNALLKQQMSLENQLNNIKLRGIDANLKAANAVGLATKNIGEMVKANSSQMAAIEVTMSLINAYGSFLKTMNSPMMKTNPIATKVLAYSNLAAGIAASVVIAQQASKLGAGGSGGGGQVYGKFEEGGYVGGNRHAQGGTIIEAERGEFVMSRNAVESIGLETLNQMNQSGGGGNINVSVSGNVLTQDFVEGELAESIKEAVRRGSDFGIG